MNHVKRFIAFVLAVKTSRIALLYVIKQKPKRGVFSVPGWVLWQWRAVRNYEPGWAEWLGDVYEFIDDLPAWVIWILNAVILLTLSVPVLLVVGYDGNAAPLFIGCSILASVLTSLLYYTKYVSESKGDAP